MGAIKWGDERGEKCGGGGGCVLSFTPDGVKIGMGSREREFSF